MYKLEEKVCKPWTISRISALITSAKNRIFSAVLPVADFHEKWESIGKVKVYSLVLSAFPPFLQHKMVEAE